jgi:hypothetical protein
MQNTKRIQKRSRVKFLVERYPRIVEEMEFQPYPEIMEYTVILMNGSKVKNNINALHWLETHLHLYGLKSVKSIIFRFRNPSYLSHYYPYSIHNIVLEKISNFLVPHFYHYYNVKNERIDIPLQQQFYDFCAIEQFLYQHPILYYKIYTNLMRPPFIYYQSPPLYSSQVSPTRSVSPPPFYLTSNPQETVMSNEVIS